MLENVDSISLDMDLLVPCGLIINELVTNSIKYAFPGGRPGTITLVTKVEGDVCILSIADDGVGMFEEIDPQKLSSLGLRLVQGLVRQMKGEIKFENLKPGFQVNLTFKF